MDNIIIFDTTLRDGEQSPGASLDIGEKLQIARQLALLNVDVIEAGFPIASPGDFQSVSNIAKEIRGVSIAALARAMEKDIDSAAKALEKAEKILQRHKIEKLPVVDKKGILRGLITFKDIMKKKRHPLACKDEHGRLRVGAAVGVTRDTFDRIDALTKAGADTIIIDTAHGHSTGVIKTIQEARKKFRYIQLIAGNIGTYEAAIDLINCKVDAIKIGIGPGSICTTRVIAGVGVPQISAVMNAYRAVKKLGIPLIADGGIKQTGDVAKVLAAGAHSVMIGSLFAGVEESPGESILYEGRSFKSYRGMGSLAAMKEGSKDRYFQDAEDDIAKLVPEGVEGRVPYKGPLEHTIYQLVGGLRAAMGYCGVKNIEQLRKNARFVKMTSSGLKESHPHDVIITQEAPNYQVKS